uniref:Uncharacterized protein n=1 Tax=virus sp. ctrcb4 TaxID=2825824 RepID=A0A8S5RPS2_9VIRU|nr:MAG TPA: hypothetical protein [virus sp. ctrcb4]DAR12775.1 MAG TPA: hypothetical protein [Crassvirales sp.]
MCYKDNNIYLICQTIYTKFITEVIFIEFIWILKTKVLSLSIK